MNKQKVASELVAVVKDLVAGEMDRELFQLYNKYQKKPYLLYVFKTQDALDNKSQIWAFVNIIDGEKLVVRYQGVGGWGSRGMPMSISNWGISKSDLPRFSVRIDDELEADLLKAKSVMERRKVILKVMKGLSKDVQRAISKGYKPLVGLDFRIS